MAMAVDHRQQMPGLPYEQMRYSAGPHFTNPWVSGAASGQMYSTAMPQQHTMPTEQARHPSHAGSISYAPNALPSLGMAQGAQAADFGYSAANSQSQGYVSRSYGTDYPATTSAATAAYTQQAPVASHFAAHDYSAQQKLNPYSTFQDRRPSHPLQTATESERSSFNDALDASRGMVAMSQDITPRNIYGAQQSSRSSIDSYGFPSSHSNASSVSSASSYGTYYGSEASYGDYSSASESIDMPNRTLPRPSGLMGGNLPPAPQSMMGSFSSKVASSSQKKHKCKICDKRFTRPSSLQTHMYSHTGEKPFACDVEGCGRHFSVVSNLRRHKKVHKGGSDHASPDDEE